MRIEVYEFIFKYIYLVISNVKYNQSFNKNIEFKYIYLVINIVNNLPLYT